MSVLLSSSRRWIGGISFWRRYSSDNLFNRKTEIETINRILRNEPSISVFTGPPDSGKSCLLNYVLKKQGADRPVLSIDLREHSFNNVDTFFSSMEGKFHSWGTSILKFAKKNLPEHLKVKFGDFEVKLDFSKIYDGEKNPNIKLEKLYRLFVDHLPLYSVWTGLKYPIIFIDEANQMARLPESGADGVNALQDLLRFFVMCTKQERKFDVFLASSDSFYHQWLSEYIGVGRCRTYVIGDLSKEEANNYWQEKIVKKYPNVKLPSFEEASSVCGTSMYRLLNYAEEYKCDPQMKPVNFSAFVQSKAKLDKALLKENAPWNRDILLSVMKRLNQSDNGFILYKPLCQEIGTGVVDAMVKANVLHMRPTTRLSFDLVNAPDESVLTPECCAAALAMKLIVKEEEQ